MSDDLLKIFAKNLKLYRDVEDISQAKLAELCGISLNYVSLIEMGRKFPGPDNIVQLAKALRVKPYHLFLDLEEDKADPVISKLIARKFLTDLTEQMKTFADGYFKG